MDILLLYCVCPFLGAFLIQFFFGCRTTIKPLRFIPLYCVVVTLIFAVRAWNTPSLFIGLNGLAAFIWGLIGVCILLGYGAALLAYKFTGQRKG